MMKSNEKVRSVILFELGLENQAGRFLERKRSHFYLGLLAVLALGSTISVSLHLALPNVFGLWVLGLGVLLVYSLVMYLGARHVAQRLNGSRLSAEGPSLETLGYVCQQVYLGSLGWTGQRENRDFQVLKAAFRVVEILLDRGKVSQSDLESHLGSQGLEVSVVRQAVDLLNSSALLDVRSNGIQVAPSQRALFF